MKLQLEIPDNDLTASLDARLQKRRVKGCWRLSWRRRRPAAADRAGRLPMARSSRTTCWKRWRKRSLAPVIFVYLFRPFEHDRLRAARQYAAAPYADHLSAFDAEEIANISYSRRSHNLSATKCACRPRWWIGLLPRRGKSFFLDELINYLHLQSIDFGDATALDRIALPDSVQRLVLSLVDRFSESQKITVKVASVIGRVFQAAWLWGVYPQIGDATRAVPTSETLRRRTAAAGARRTRLPISSARSSQGVTYAEPALAVKSALHEQIGDFLEATYAGTLDLCSTCWPSTTTAARTWRNAASICAGPVKPRRRLRQ